MAKCDLSIELDEPDKTYSGGGTIAGIVRVQVDADVKCKGLEVSSVWRTHGRGNVASGNAGSTTLFSGEWRAGENPSYRFELPVADWPPSYHGHYLNIDHYVEVRAKIPWGFDPQASVPFVMRPTCGPDGAEIAKNVTEVKGVLGCIIGIIVLAFMFGFVVMLAQLGLFALLFLLLPMAGFLYWVFRVFLPQYRLGDVRYQFASQPISPGESAAGELVIRPRKNVSINAVTMHFKAREQCVSGSGSNRTTHKHVFFEKLNTLQDATTLRAGNEHRFELAAALPEEAPYSMDLDDNELIWSATLRVDIPRWPDWVQEVPLRVVPRGEGKVSEVSPSGAASPGGTPEPSALQANEADEPAAQGITFGETVTHVWATRSDRDQVETVVDAVRGLTFDFAAMIERRLLYSGEDDPHVYEDGYAVWARYTDPELPLVLYVPHELADEFEQVGRNVWRGRGTIVGWDSLHGRLQIKLERPT